MKLYNSIRGIRYFGPSKMSILGLILHSLKFQQFLRDYLYSCCDCNPYVWFTSLLLFILFFNTIFRWLGIFIFIICLALDDNIKKLNNSHNNIKSLSDIYSR